MLSLAREGGHSRARVVHAGGAATGAEVERALVEATWQSAGAVLERWFALDLLVENGRCRGVLALPPVGPPIEIRAEHVLLATGGAGQLFAVTTNPHEATGDGIAMALRAGVPVADLEFVQFHPTALHHPAMPRPLLSEALRGHGAVLRDARGDRFVDELASRDVVSRAMATRMSKQGTDHLWLDATGLEKFDEHFPTISDSLRSIRLDPSVDWLPIAPAAHHLSGGVVTDLSGATALTGLWAAGEVACTGVHGANRLASNSLLEGMVFGARVAERIAEGAPDAEPNGPNGPESTGVMASLLGDGSVPIGARVARPVKGVPMPVMSRGIGEPPESGAHWGDPVDVAKLREHLQQAMTAGAGVVRDEASLAASGSVVDEVAAMLGDGRVRAGAEAGELANLVTVARAILGSASERVESRGAHTRADFPETDLRWQCRLVHGTPSQDAPPSGR